MNITHNGILPAALFAALLLTSCSDWNDDGTETIPSDPTTQEENIGIAFSGSVVNKGSATVSRADGSIINLDETHLHQSQPHRYYRADEDGNVDPAGVEVTFYAGIFGCYTGPNRWSKLVDISKQASISEDDKKTLEDHYTANLFFNQQAYIYATDGRDSLTYSPLRFWPNNKLGAKEHEYATFWAYYPYNPTSGMGQYGITMNTEKGQGMDTIHFTMHPDASQQVDFMVSDPVVDCNKDKYPLISTDVGQYTSKPVPFNFRHMLAQVRIYAFINGTDYVVYQQDDKGEDIIADETWFDNWKQGETITDAYGNVYTKTNDNKVEQTTKKESLEDEYPDEKYTLTKEEFVALRLRVPDEEKSQRWKREDVWDLAHTHRRAKLDYKLSFNNIYTSADFFPLYTNDGAFVSMDHTPASTLGSATINHYIMNPYWFQFDESNKRPILNDEYMFGYFEGTAASNEDKLYYIEGKEELDKNELADVDNKALHYNFCPGNILMVVPQTLKDDNVPHIVLRATGTDAKTGEKRTALLTINLLNMRIVWESGYIYCYAFLDELRPGDDKVKGPESVTVAADNSQYTDQW